MIYDAERKVFQCPNCKGWWQLKIPSESCAVFHQGTGCCHYGQDEVDPPEEEIDFGGREIEHSDFYEEPDDDWEFRGRW